MGLGGTPLAELSFTFVSEIVTVTVLLVPPAVPLTAMLVPERVHSTVVAVVNTFFVLEPLVEPASVVVGAILSVIAFVIVPDADAPLILRVW